MSDYILPNFNLNEVPYQFNTSIYFENEEERNSIHNNFKRIMFIGKSGIGKSTLLNLFYHNTFNLDVVSDKPAKTSSSASGETDGISCYPEFNQERIYIDTIGLTDNRFKHAEILSAIRSFIRGIVHGLNVIIICINYGRIDADERRTLDMMEVIFGSNVFRNSTVVTFNSPLQVSREQWENTLDEETIKLSNCKQVLFANNTPGTNNIEQFQDLRKKLIQNFEFIMDNNSDNLYKPADGFLERAYDFFQLLFPSILVPDYKQIFQGMWKEIEKDCSVCLCSILKEQEIVLSCNHTFHRNCINTWNKYQNKKLCPNCRQ